MAAPWNGDDGRRHGDGSRHDATAAGIARKGRRPGWELGGAGGAGAAGKLAGAPPGQVRATLDGSLCKPLLCSVEQLPSATIASKIALRRAASQRLALPLRAGSVRRPFARVLHLYFVPIGPLPPAALELIQLAQLLPHPLSPLDSHAHRNRFLCPRSSALPAALPLGVAPPKSLDALRSDVLQVQRVAPGLLVDFLDIGARQPANL